MTQRLNSNKKFKNEQLQIYDAFDADPLEAETSQQSNDTESELFNDVTSPLRIFLHKYRAFPELWDSFNPFYLNKAKRRQAYNELLVVYKLIKPEANIEDVKKKINSLRSNYRKELKKIADSKLKSSSENATYKPTSWVFYELQFLENVAETRTLLKPNDSMESLEHQNSFEHEDIEETLSIINIKRENQQSIKKAKRKSTANTEINSKLPLLELDLRIPTIAQVWGEKLMELEVEQRNFAEKAINDILFEASMGTLQRNSVRINEFQ